MALLLTLILDIAMFLMLTYRIVGGDQLIFLITTMLQALFFFDLLAILLLHPKKVEAPVDLDSDMGRRARRKKKPKKRKKATVWITFFSMLIALGLLIYYAINVYFIFF